MGKRPRSTLLLLAVLVISVCQPAVVTGTGPFTPSGKPGAPLAPGSIRLPNGRILPAQPPGLERPSEMAVEWLAHANDRIVFTPGARPHALVAPPIVQTVTDPSAGAGVDLIPLAPTDGSGSQATLASLPNGLRKQVFGFLPYWMLNASDLQWMRYDLISTIAYFGVAARSDGSLATSGSTWSGWNSAAMTGVINAAHRKGDRVVLTVTMMAWDSASASAQATLLKKHLMEADEPVIFGADLNENSGGAAWRTLADGLVDAAVAVGAEGRSTFPAADRSDLNAARSSAAKSSGCSHAAKCPPLSTS